jgi:MFS family permease
MLYAPALFIGLADSVPRAAAPDKTRTGKGASLRILAIPTYLSLCFNFIAINAMLWVIYAWLPDFLHHKFQLSLAVSGSTATVYVQSATIIGILTGASVADQLVRKSCRGRLYILLAGLTLACPFFYGVGHSGSLLAVKISALGYGFFKGAYVANFFASVIDIVPEHNRGFAVGFANMIGSISGGLSAYLVGLLKSALQPEALYSFGTGLGVIAAVTLAITVWRLFPKDYGKVHPPMTDRVPAMQP